jgi:hypothetical protein
VSKKKRKQSVPETRNVPEPEQAPAPDSRLRAPRWLPGLFVVVVAVAAFGAYSGTLDHGFTNWDDNWLITENRHIRGLGWDNIQTMFNPMSPREELGNEYLPLRDLSYSVNYALDGYDARGYHATNLLLHIFNSLLVMLLAWRLTTRRWIGCVAGLLFAVMPVHVEAVAWLSSRKDLLATFFLLGSANLYLAARMARTHVMPSESFVRRVRGSKRMAYSLALLFFVFALMSKMTAVVLPALLLLIELFRGPSLHAATKPRRALMAAPFWGIAVLFTALASHIGSGLMREPYGDSRLQSLLTATSAITRDFQVMLAGWPLHAAVDMPVQTGLALPVIVGALILIALIALGVRGWVVSRRGEWGKEACMAWGAAGFGALWFLVALSPVSNFVVQIGTVFAERYLYIPAIGIAIAVATLGVMAVDELRRRRELRPLVHFAALAVLLGVVGVAIWRTHDAAKSWAGSERLWTDALAHDPGNHVGHFNLGRAFEDRALNEPDEAARAELLAQAYTSYESALNNPARTYRNDPARVLGAMALNQVHRGNPEAALDLLERAKQHIDLPWRHAEAKADILALLANPRGLALSAMGRHEEALAAFEDSLKHSKRYLGARINLAAELGRKALAGDTVDEARLNRALSELAEYERARGRDELLLEARARLRLAEFDKRLAVSGKGGERDIPAELQPILDESRELYGELVSTRKAGAATPSQMAGTLVEAADAMARGSPGDRRSEQLLREAMDVKPSYIGLRTLLAQLLFERDEPAARRDATKLLEAELKQHPDYKPALKLKAAGLRQNFVNEIARLQSEWRAEFVAAFNDDTPTLEGLIRKFHKREAFRKHLLTCVALLHTATETDPDSTEAHTLMDDLGARLAIGMWITQDTELRIVTEDLLRTGFNANSVDGRISGILTRLYTELAQQVVSRPAGDESSAKRKREDLDSLLENMLKLSERARRILSKKLFEIGDNVDRGETELMGEDGNPLTLSSGARRMAASEFIRAATLLNPENIVALDWLKVYYEETGEFEEALDVFNKLIAAMGDRPDLWYSVNLALAQLQSTHAEGIHRSFQHKIKLGDEAGARELRQKLVPAYLAVVKTTGELIDNPQDPDKIALPIRLRGAACQRLAYYLTADAEKYYTIALEAYARVPLDFGDEIADVRRKRSWFVRDPYKKLEELKQIRRDAPTGKDLSDVIAEIINLERRIARIEAEAQLKAGNPQRALEMLQEAMKAPTPEMHAIRGRIYLELAARAEGKEAEKLKVLAAKDLVSGGSDPEALLEGAKLYWTDEALRFEEDAMAQARRAFVMADDLFGVALAAMDKDAPERERYREQRQYARDELKKMERVGAQYLALSEEQQGKGDLDAALRHARTAVEFVGDSPVALLQLGCVHRALADGGGDAASRHAADARATFTAALRIDHLLTSQRLELQFELVSLLLDHFQDKAAARNWLEIAQRTLDHSEGGDEKYRREKYQPVINELRDRAR